MRLSGVRDMAIRIASGSSLTAAIIAVSIEPGPTALTLMPCGASASALALVSCITPALGGAVGRDRGDRDLGVDRRHVDDRARDPRRDHGFRRALGGEEGADEVHVDDPGELLQRGFEEVARHRDAGAVHQHRERADLGLDAVEQGADPIGIPHVAGDRRRAPAEAGRRRLDAGRVDVGEHDPRAVLRDGLGAGIADAARPAGDQRRGCFAHPVLPLDSERSGDLVGGEGRAVEPRFQRRQPVLRRLRDRQRQIRLPPAGQQLGHFLAIYLIYYF